MAAVRDWWRRHTPLTKVLLVLASLASAGTVVILVFIVNLFLAGYSGGNNPQSINALAFPLSFFFFVIAGVPAVLISAGLWVGFGITAARTSRRQSARP